MRFAEFILSDFYENNGIPYEPNVLFSEFEIVRSLVEYIQQELDIEIYVRDNLMGFEGDETEVRKDAIPGFPTFWFF